MAYDRNKRESGRRGGFGGRSFRDRDSNDSDDRGFGGNRRFGGGGRGGFGGRTGGRDSGRRPLEMFSVTCDDCGKKCEVPFKPTSGKPVFCSECFEKKGSSRSGGSSGSSVSSGLSTNQYNIINAKLDKIMHALKIAPGKDDEDADTEEDSDEDEFDDEDEEN